MSTDNSESLQYAHDIATLLTRLERLSRSDDGEAGLNPAQWEALRYVAQANRFSRHPAALAAYLGSTRGTVSQTLIALEQKGFVSRTPSPTDKRSVLLSLTAKGETALARDPLHRLALDLDEANDAGTIAAMRAALQATVLRFVSRNNGKAFGMCQTCRYFEADASGTREANHCALLNVPLSRADSEAICAEQVA